MATVNLRYNDIIGQFTGEKDFAEWVDKLEMVARLQGVKDLQSFMPLFLSGGAFAVYKGLSEDVKADYVKVKSAMLQAFSLDQIGAYEEFARRRLQDGESVDIYVADLARLAQLVHPMGVHDDWVKCAFVTGLPDAVRTQIRVACSVSSMSLANTVDRARQMMKTSELCISAAALNFHHKGPAKWNTRVVKCYNCGEEGHMSKDCEKRRATRQCFVCGSEEHLAAKCTNRHNSQLSKNE